MRATVGQRFHGTRLGELDVELLEIPVRFSNRLEIKINIVGFNMFANEFNMLANEFPQV
jgi:hypothetical protein